MALNSQEIEAKHTAKDKFAFSDKELNYVQLFQAGEPEMVGLVLRCYVLTTVLLICIRNWGETTYFIFSETLSN